MTSLPKLLFCLLLLLSVMASPLAAKDMRELQIQAELAKEALARKALEEKTAAEKSAAETLARILEDRTALEKTVAELETAKGKLTTEKTQLTEKNDKLSAEESQLDKELEQTGSMIRELVGVIRVNAKDIDTLIRQNLQTGVIDRPLSLLGSITEDSRFPGMDDIRTMTASLLDQIHASGEVAVHQGKIVGRAGRDILADILLVGPFTAAYRSDGETGFLNYSSTNNTLYALSRLPATRIQKQMGRYMEGQDEVVPLDISRGGALRQITNTLSLAGQIKSGGPIVWPILAILVIGIGIVIERLFVLLRNRHKSLPLIDRIRTLSKDSDWQGCEEICRQWITKPIARVLLAGLHSRHMQREDMENVLQEAILKEIPPLERFLSTLGMLIAIAPLLGLLGTVTGMINVFHVITMHGTSDPRLMSGGISEALVTTMLGLSVAIPLMLLHNILSRTVDGMIGEMEEKSVALVNVIHKNRGI